MEHTRVYVSTTGRPPHTFVGTSDQSLPYMVLCLGETITHLRAELYVALKEIERLQAEVEQFRAG